MKNKIFLGLLTFFAVLFCTPSVSAHNIGVDTVKPTKRVDSSAFTSLAAIKSFLVINQSGATRQFAPGTLDRFTDNPIISVVGTLPSSGNTSYKGYFAKESNGSVITAYVDSSGNRHAYASPDLSSLNLIGEVKMYAGSDVPSGFLRCEGQTVSKAAYANLYAKIGGQFGESQDSFSLPDLRERFVMGGSNRGNVGGNSTVTLDSTHLPSHTHSIAGEVKVGVADQEGSSSAATNNVLGSRALETATDPATRIESYVSGAAATLNAGNKLGAVTHDLQATAKGDNEAFSILPPFIVLSYIIRVQ